MPIVSGPLVVLLLEVGAGVPHAATPTQSPIASVHERSRIPVLSIVSPFAVRRVRRADTQARPISGCQTAVCASSFRASSTMFITFSM
jgi:hypothetical protein